MSFKIDHRTVSNVEVMDLSGRLTLGEGTSMLRGELTSALDRNIGILLNMSAVTYVDSAGLGQLVEGHSLAAARGKAIKLLNPHKRIDSLLHITKLNSTFETFEDEAVAVASFKE